MRVATLVPAEVIMGAPLTRQACMGHTRYLIAMQYLQQNSSTPKIFPMSANGPASSILIRCMAQPGCSAGWTTLERNLSRVPQLVPGGQAAQREECQQCPERT